MKNKKMNKVVSCLLVLVVMFCLNLTVSANSVFDSNKKGSITVTLRDQTSKEPVANAEITVYKVADAKVVDNNLTFEFTKEFQNCGASVDDYHKTEFASKLADYIKEKQIKGPSLATDKKGVAKFTDLSLGIYLGVQTGEVDGYSSFLPFVLALPVTSDNQWVYDMDVTPKIDIVKHTDITVQKLWNDDNGAGATKRPENVKIQLLSGKKVVDTVTLSDKNEWKHTWTDLIKRDDYSVKELNVPKGYKATYQQKEFTFTVTNTAKLVQTGQLNWPIPILIISGLILIAVGYVLHSRSKHHE